MRAAVIVSAPTHLAVAAAGLEARRNVIQCDAIECTRPRTSQSRRPGLRGVVARAFGVCCFWPETLSLSRVHAVSSLSLSSNLQKTEERHRRTHELSVRETEERRRRTHELACVSASMFAQMLTRME